MRGSKALSEKSHCEADRSERSKAVLPSLYALLSRVGLCHHLGNPLEHFEIHLVGFLLHDTLMLTLLAEVLALPLALLAISLAFPFALLAFLLVTLESSTKLLPPQFLVLFQTSDKIRQMGFFARPFPTLL